MPEKFKLELKRSPTEERAIELYEKKFGPLKLGKAAVASECEVVDSPPDVALDVTGE